MAKDGADVLCVLGRESAYLIRRERVAKSSADVPFVLGRESANLIVFVSCSKFYFVLHDGDSQDILFKPWRRALTQLKVKPALTVEEYSPEPSVAAVGMNQNLPASKSTRFPVESRDTLGQEVPYLRPVVSRASSVGSRACVLEEG